MFKDFENWLNINTLQTSAYVRNLHYLLTLSSISVYVRNLHHLPHLPTLSSISGHYRRFQLNDLLSQLTKLAIIVDRHSPSPSPPPPPHCHIYFYFYSPDKWFAWYSNSRWPIWKNKTEIYYCKKCQKQMQEPCPKNSITV